MIEQKINEFFGDAESTGFGTGWWSGILSAFFGFLSFGAVLCLHFPQLLTSPELRPHYPMQTMRVFIQCLIVARDFLRGHFLDSAQEKSSGIDGNAVCHGRNGLGWIQRSDQRHTCTRARHRPRLVSARFVFDGAHLRAARKAVAAVSATRNIQEPVDFGRGLFHVHASSRCKFCLFWFCCPPRRPRNIWAFRFFKQSIARLPWLLQFFLAIVVADVAEYFIHLAFHKVPFLWRFHAIHHSSKALDWIAGSRSHFVDDTLVRGFILVPLMLGFSQTIILAYLIFVTLHATWTHCNFGPNAKWLEKFLVMPRYHHWHHTSQKEGIDKNFAIHFPWIDKIFGTYYFPKRGRSNMAWTAKRSRPAFFGQTIEPFTKKKRDAPKNSARRVERPWAIPRPVCVAFTKPRLLHHFHGQKSKVIFRFVVAQPQ